MEGPAVLNSLCRLQRHWSQCLSAWPAFPQGSQSAWLDSSNCKLSMSKTDLPSFPQIRNSHLVSCSGEWLTQARNFGHSLFLETCQLLSNHVLSLSLFASLHPVLLSSSPGSSLSSSHLHSSPELFEQLLTHSFSNPAPVVHAQGDSSKM